ncbi:MAG: V-type ATPase subunit [Clostridiaceae bacterium]|jgi:V/A-type H+-transporting ATPase subunit C|nr:V-type ATPase subunit [Clostridiaceae bacterium]
MDSITRFAAVNTKIKAMEGEFLKNEDYISLLGLESVTEVARYLKEKTAYSDVLANVETEYIHRAMLENLVKQKMVKNIDRIIHYFTGDYKSFIRTLYAKYEIEELKVIARAVYNGEDTAAFRSNAFVGKYSNIDTSKIYESKHIRDIIYALQGSEFYKFLIPLVDGNFSENPFRFAMVMDLAYYSILQSKWSKLDTQDIRVLEQAQGIMADLLNIQWIYRGIKFYRLSPEELLNYTINIGYRLDFNLLKALCYSQNLEEFNRIVKSTKYGFMLKEDETTDIYMERRMERHIYFELKDMVRKNNLSIIGAFAFVIFLQYEVRDIISIVEAIRYKIPVDQAHKYIVRKL